MPPAPSSAPPTSSGSSSTLAPMSTALISAPTHIGGSDRRALPAPDALIWHRRDALDLPSGVSEHIVNGGDHVGDAQNVSSAQRVRRRNHLEHRGWLLNEPQVKPARTVYTTW